MLSDKYAADAADKPPINAADGDGAGVGDGFALNVVVASAIAGALAEPPPPHPASMANPLASATHCAERPKPVIPTSIFFSHAARP
jgi:hypothetical protein